MTESKRFGIKIGEFEEENIVDNLNKRTIREISDMCKKMTENKRFTIDNNGKYFDRLNNRYLTIDNLLNELNELNNENKELKLQLEAFKDKLCELGVSDVKLYGKRYYTGLEEWLE